MGEYHKIESSKQNTENKIMDNAKQPIETTQIPEINRIFCKKIELFAQSLNQKAQTVLDKYPTL